MASEAQRILKSKPLYVVTDKSEKYTNENEAFYLKNYWVNFNLNQQGTEGGNFGLGTPTRSNKRFAAALMPAGKNVNIGTYQSKETNQLFYLNWNSNNLHGIYRIDGDTMRWDIVVVDPALNFSLDPAFQIPHHRVSLRAYYKNNNLGAGKQLEEMYLEFTNGLNWQYFIGVEAAIATGGYDPEKFNYWKLRNPQLDRREFFELAIRPPMFPITVVAVPPTPDDVAKPNAIVDKSIQFAAVFQNRDHRTSTYSPYSLPFIQKTNPCNFSQAGLSRCLDLTINVGSAMVERVLLYQRLCGGDWCLYDTIERFGQQEEDSGPYWERTGDWKGMAYDAVSNTIVYRYCGDKQTGIVPQEDAQRIQTDLPLVSVGQTAAGDAVLLLDNLYGYNNFPQKELDKLQVTVEDVPETAGAYDIVKTRKIILYAYMSNASGFNAFIWTNGADKTLRFGGITSPINPNVSFLDMTFSAQYSDYLGLGMVNNKGLVCYLAGTSFYSVGVQGFIDKGGNFTEQDSFDATSNEQKNLIQNLYQQGKFMVQKFEFDVPAGKYIARLARHGVDINSQYEKTSTYVIGIADKNKINGMNGLPTYSAVETVAKEIEVDVCTGDFNSWSTNLSLFYLFVPYVFEESGFLGIKNKRWRFIEGYVQEDAIAQVPVERVVYDRAGGLGGLLAYLRKGVITDHNGHYFVYMAKATSYKGEVIFSAIANCNPYAQIAETAIHLNSHQDSGFYPDQNISLKDAMGGTYGTCNRIQIKGTILDCKTKQPLSGVAVTITSGQTAFTGIDGTFILIAHDGNATYLAKIYANASGACFLMGCGVACIDTQPFDSSKALCNSCVDRIYPADFNFSFTFSNQNIYTVKEGGRYGISVQGHDLAGRITFANFLKYVDIPSFLQKGNFNPSQIVVNLTDVLILDRGISYISFSITKELTNLKYIQWVGDSIVFLDKDGNTLVDGNGAIRAKISIQSLLDYNKQNNFATTVGYQFSPGDRLRVYDDGNGNLFDPTTNNGYLDFQILGSDFNQSVQGESTTESTSVTDATTGITTTNNVNASITGKDVFIAFDKRLLVLNKQCAFWMQLSTPNTGAQVESYFELPKMYYSNDGTIQPQKFIMAAFDAYYQNRSIHITNCAGKAILHPFVSSSVSDFWGDGCTSGGRVLVRNTQAAQRWYQDDVIKSDDFVNEGQVNGWGTWRGSNRKQFKGQERGGIVAAVAKNKLILFICQNDWYVTDYDLNLLRNTPNGLIVATADSIIGDPNQKMESTFGCEYENTGTIQIMEGDKDYVFWACAKKETVIINDYRTASPYTQKGGTKDSAAIDNKSYFSDKFNYVRNWNNSLSSADYLENLMEINLGVDNKSKSVSISFRKRNGLSTQIKDFVNTERGKFIPLNETFTYSLEQDRWVSFQTFVPESYGQLNKALSGDEFISFVNGIPYTHNSKDVKTFNEFYGVSDNQVIDVAFYGKEDRDQTYQCIIITSPNAKYFVDRITTNNKRVFSYVPPAWVKSKLNNLYSTLLRNMLTYPSAHSPVPSLLIDGGGKISGEWCRIRIVRDPSQLNSYSEIDHILMQFISTSQK